MTKAVIKIDAYKCRVCGTLHTSPYKAEDCCHHTISLSAWKCEKCGCLYPTKEEAELCEERRFDMENATKVLAYECPVCGAEYTDYYYALEHCAPTLVSKHMWRCASCNELWLEKEAAETCCDKLTNEG